MTDGTRGSANASIGNKARTGNITVSTIENNYYQGKRPGKLSGANLRARQLRSILEPGRFADRDDIIARINRMVTGFGKGYILVTGPADVGKSALAAHLADSRGHAFHSAGQSPEWRSPVRARWNIAAQLIEKWRPPEYADDLLPEEADEPGWLLGVLEAVARKRGDDPQAPPVVVVVDGLDEADPAVPERDTRIPFGLPGARNLPDRVFIIVTCRLGTAREWLDVSSQRTVELRPSSTENKDSMRRYIAQFLRGDNPDVTLVRLLAAAHVSADEFIATLADRSEGSWTYVRCVLDDLREGSGGVDAAQLDNLPTGLENYYRQQFSKWMQPTTEWAALRLPVLATLAALPVAMTAADIAGYTGISDVDAVTGWIEGGLRPFLDLEDEDEWPPRYRIAHRSLRDTLSMAGGLSRSNSGRGPGHALIADACKVAHEKIAWTLLPTPGELDDLVQWEARPPAKRAWLPRLAALGGIIGELLPHAAFHLSCPPHEIIRIKRYLKNGRDIAAVAALEMAQAHWGNAASDRDRAWWLHVWARRFGADDLALSASRLSGRAESVVRAIWLGTAHRVLTSPSAGDGKPEHVWCLIPVELGGETLLAAGIGSTVRLWDVVTGDQHGCPMTGHRGLVLALAQLRSPEGLPVLASGGEDGLILLWPLQGGQTTGVPLQGHVGPVTTLAGARLASGQSCLISGGYDGTVRQWQWHGGGSTVIGRHDGPVAALTVLHLGERTVVASGGELDGVRFWDVIAESASPGLPDASGPWEVKAEPLDPSAWQATPALIDPRASPGAPAIPGAVSALGCISALQDVPVLVTAGDSQEISLWRVLGDQASELVPEPAGTLRGHEGTVLALSVVRESGRDQPPLIASGGADRNLRLWNPLTLAQVGKPLTGHSEAVWAVAVVSQPDQQTVLASAGGDRTLRVWDPPDDTSREQPLHGHLGGVTAIMPMRHGHLLASASEDGTIQLWDTRAPGPPRATLTGHDGRVAGMAAVEVAGDHTVLVTGGDDRTIRVWDVRQTGTRVGHRVAVRHAKAVSCLSSRRDGAEGLLLAFGDADGGAEVWDLLAPASRPVRLSRPARLPRPESLVHLDGSRDPQDDVNIVLAVSFIDLEKGQTVVATGGKDKQVQVWDPATGRQWATFAGHAGFVRSIHPVTLPGGRFLASGGDDSVIRVWDPRTGAEFGMPLDGHSAAIHTVLAVDQLGWPGLIASGGSDSSVCLWDLNSRSRLGAPLLGHTGTIRSLALVTGPDGPMLATAGEDHSIMVWDLRDRLTPGQSPQGTPETQGLDGHHVPW